MGRLSREDRGPIALAEKVLTLLDEGRFTATYKYAVLLALIDLCLENTTHDGEAPDMVTTEQLAEKIIEIYWPHSTPYPTGDGAMVLRQSGGGRDTQAEILRAIEKFRNDHAPDPSTPLARSRRNAPDALEKLVHFVEWKLIQMPLPRLQYFGRQHDPFLYQISWGRKIPAGPVRRYQRGERDAFDNRINLRPGVGEYLVQLNGLLRPLIHRQWAVMVAQMNRLEESRLQEFLFGAERIPMDSVRPALQEIQEGRCFYCGERIGTGSDRGPAVDHFVPWARFPNNAIENLVIAHRRCNGHKRDFLAASDHVVSWRERFEPDSFLASVLTQAAQDLRWESAPDRSLSVARAIYLRLPEDARLWLRGQTLVPVDRGVLETVLS